MCGDCVSDCVFGFDIDLFSSLTPCFAVTLADCIFEQLVSRQELLVYQLRPSIAGSSGSSTKELANEAMAALIRSQSGEAGLFVSTVEDDHSTGVEQDRFLAGGSAVDVDLAYDQEDQERFMVPPNPLAALLTTCFN